MSLGYELTNFADAVDESRLLEFYNPDLCYVNQP
jgi:hypothetical protein